MAQRLGSTQSNALRQSWFEEDPGMQAAYDDLAQAVWEETCAQDGEAERAAKARQEAATEKLTKRLVRLWMQWIN
jgi:hypothetical protein